MCITRLQSFKDDLNRIYWDIYYSTHIEKAPWHIYYDMCQATKPALIQNRFCIKTVMHLLSKLQNWICPETGQYKTSIVSNTRIEASIRATKPKLWQSHLTSETVEIFIQNEKAGLVPMQSRFWCGMLSVGTKPILVQQVKGRHKAGFGAGTKPILERLV